MRRPPPLTYHDHYLLWTSHAPTYYSHAHYGPTDSTTRAPPMALPPPYAGFLLDLHASCAGNPHLPYVELYPYLDSLWFGEQCECAASPPPRHLVAT